jgi:hypothetical protein
VEDQAEPAARRRRRGERVGAMVIRRIASRV